MIGYHSLAVGHSPLSCEHNAGNGREVLQAWIVERVRRVVWHLRCDFGDVFRGAGGEVWRGESESTVCPSIVRLKVDGHLLFPLAPITEV